MDDSWLEAFRLDPDRAVGDLFNGRAGTSSDLRLDLPELLHQTFPPQRVNERARLDEALWTWLLGMRESQEAEVDRLGFAVYGKRLCDALVALQLLELPRTRSRLREDLDAWLRWLRPLRLAPERDPALECLRLVTLDQPDDGDAALWLRLAEDPRPEYLSVALGRIGADAPPGRATEESRADGAGVAAPCRREPRRGRRGTGILRGAPGRPARALFVRRQILGWGCGRGAGWSNRTGAGGNGERLGRELAGEGARDTMLIAEPGASRGGRAHSTGDRRAKGDSTHDSPHSAARGALAPSSFAQHAVPRQQVARRHDPGRLVVFSEYQRGLRPEFGCGRVASHAPRGRGLHGVLLPRLLPRCRLLRCPLLALLAWHVFLF